MEVGKLYEYVEIGATYFIATNRLGKQPTVRGDVPVRFGEIVFVISRKDEPWFNSGVHAIGPSGDLIWISNSSFISFKKAR